MNRDAGAILALCSQLCANAGVRPLEPKEYSILAARLRNVQKTPGDLFDFSQADFSSVLNLACQEAERLKRLLDRSAGLGGILARYENMGIRAMTRADRQYPKNLKKKLGNSAPPIFYYAGNSSLLDGPLMGYTGSRNITGEDLDFTTGCVRKTVQLGYGVVSGGAKGVDTVAVTEALHSGGVAVEYLSESLLKKLKRDGVVSNIQQGRLLVMSVSNPDAEFRTGIAMMRNRYIYAQSAATVVVRADLEKGGTWAGACDSLEKGWCPVLCWDHPYPGNRALIQKGAIPVCKEWNGRIPSFPPDLRKESFSQTSLFDRD